MRTSEQPAFDPHGDTAASAKPPPKLKRRMLEVGDVVANRYRIVRFIAGGGMGEVYEAIDAKLDLSIALKLVRADVADDPLLIERFKDEVRLGMRITHPNVCRVFDFGVHPVQSARGDHDLPFMTMELLSGDTLATRIGAGALPEGEALKLMSAVISGLHVAHQQGVIHRDFKPLNVILAPDGRGGLRPVITDFGLALLQGGQRRSVAGQLFGTPEYLAPEQLTGGEITPATDVYALGVTLFEMVTGSTPFNEPTAVATAMKRLWEAPPSPRLKAPDISDRLEAAILKCLAQKPQERFGSVEELQRYLRPSKEDASRPHATQESDVAFVISMAGVEVGNVYQVRSGTIIGRSDEADIVLSDDTVSRKHARLELNRGRWRLVDLNSSNGIRPFGAPRTDALALGNGTEFCVGHSILAIACGDEAAMRARLAALSARASQFDGVVPLALNKTRVLQRIDEERARAAHFRRAFSVVTLQVRFRNDEERQDAGVGVAHAADRDLGLLLSSRLDTFQHLGRLAEGRFVVLLPEIEQSKALEVVAPLLKGLPDAVEYGGLRIGVRLDAVPFAESTDPEGTAERITEIDPMLMTMTDHPVVREADVPSTAVARPSRMKKR